MTSPLRLCPICGVPDPIRDNENVWPAGWTCANCHYVMPESDGIPLLAPDLADTAHGFDPADFAVLAAVEAEHFWFVPRNRLIVTLIDRHFPRASSILEVGCGTGMVLSAIAQSRPWQRVVGAELHTMGLAEARKRLGQSFRLVQMDARSIPARDAFDVVGAFDVIEHIAEDEQVLAAMRNAIVPGGGAVIAVPQHPMLWSDVDDQAHHVRRYRRGELEMKFERAGFRILFSASYTVVLFPLMAASRLLRRIKGADRTTDGPSDAKPLRTEFRLPRSLNALVRATLQAEVSTTLAGLRFPFGGSRIVVAAKR
jgi:SAM-dependent methyltransferase